MSEMRNVKTNDSGEPRVLDFSSVRVASDIEVHLLAALREVQAARAQGQRSGSGPSFEPDVEAALKRIKSFRRKRDRILGKSLFSDPAWEILLDLYAAQLAMHRVSVSSAVIASLSPHTTGLRWLTNLEKEGLIERKHDPLDARRTFVQLSKVGVSKMQQLFS